MIGLYIFISVFTITIGAITVVREIQAGKTKRTKMNIRAFQIDKYNDFLEDSGQHLVSDEVIKTCRINERPES